MEGDEEAEGGHACENLDTDTAKVWWKQVSQHINDGRHGRMPPKSTHRTYGSKGNGGSGKRPQEDGDAAGGPDGANAKAKKTRVNNAERDHCPPYDTSEAAGLNADETYISAAAHEYYEILGRCQCVAPGMDRSTWGLTPQKCDHSKMVRNKYTPWTRFPVGNGRFFGEEFVTWKNPMACRSRADVRDIWEPNLTAASGGGPRLVVKFDRNEMNKNKWMKFWYAVHMLHEWVIRIRELDEATLLQYISAYYNGAKDLYKDRMKEDGRREAGAFHHYTEAGLLREEDETHRQLFQNFRDPVLYNLHPSQQDALRDLLLAEKKRVVILFGKVAMLRSLACMQNTRLTFRRLELITTQPEADAAAGLMALMERAEAEARKRGDPAEEIDALFGPCDIDEDTAASNLNDFLEPDEAGESTGGPTRTVGPAGGMQTLLKCLQDLAVD